MKRVFTAINNMTTIMIVTFIIATLSLILFCKAFAGAEEALPAYNLWVSFDVARGLLIGRARITLPDDKERSVSTAGLRIVSATFNGQPLNYREKEEAFLLKGKGAFEITYEASFVETTAVYDPQNPGVVSQNIIGDKGISLTYGWYPSFGDMALWAIEAVVPKNLVAISEADEIVRHDTHEGAVYSFRFPYPLDAVNLIAGHYTEKRVIHNNRISIYAYFFPEDSALAEGYLESAAKYLTRYEGLLGPFPFKRFSIVENILSTGYSMPTFTLLGADVIRLPFIKDTSLGHEIVHQWLGNCVYVDYTNGNWVEGITSCLSDHLYEEEKGAGWGYRKKTLTDYRSYVIPSKESPIKEFTGRSDFASSAIGYGKGAMLFHMLKGLIGEDTFYTALRMFISEKKFTRASWTDLQADFEKASGKGLDWFFHQWLNRRDIPSLSVEDMRVVMKDGAPTVSFEILQKGEPYTLALPVKIITEKGEIRDTLSIKKDKEYFEIPVAERPLKIVFDEGYDVMRRLHDKEFPPVLARLLGDEKRLIVYSPEEEEKYSELIKVFKEAGFDAKGEIQTKDEAIKASSILVLGSGSPILRRLFGEVEKPVPGFTLIVRQNPLNTEKVVAYAEASSKEEVDPVVRKIFHYGKYSVIGFRDGKNTEKKTEESMQGMAFTLYEPVMGIDPKRAVLLTDIIGQVIDTPVIYVGERHSSYEDHKVQIEVIETLYKRGKRFAIGMEMFQTPFQKALDDYLAGKTSEREFLKASEYFKRWRFDYLLYREVIDFAKAKGIPIVALNIREEITKKVTEGGLDALTDEERSEIPRDMNMDDADYRDTLKGFFKLHQEFHIKNFDNFFQSQILWDETMAHSIAKFMTDHPDYQMVVFAGGQHIMFGSGIPQRTHRLNKKQYATLINGSYDDLTENIGDFLLFPAPIDAPESPKLGVIIKEEEGKVMVEKLSPEGAAQKVGIKEGDFLLSVEDWNIESLEDVKIGLFDKRRGDTVKVKVLRSLFLWGKKQIEFSVTL